MITVSRTSLTFGAGSARSVESGGVCAAAELSRPSPVTADEQINVGNNYNRRA